MNVSITFTPDGQGRCLHTEAINLGTIGCLSIRRATRIEFDNQKQVWRVYMVRGRVALFNSPSRRTCLEWERRYLESQEDMKHGLHHGPGSVTAGP